MSGQLPPAAQAAQNASANGQLGEPKFRLDAAGGGSNLKNYGVSSTAAVGMKVFESENRAHSVGVGASYSQSFGRSQGHSWQSKPNKGVGVNYTFRF